MQPQMNIGTLTKSNSRPTRALSPAPPTRNRPANCKTDPIPTPVLALDLISGGIDFVVALAAESNNTSPKTVQANPESANRRICVSALGSSEKRAGLLRVTASGDTRETLARGETLYLPEHLERCEHALVYSIGMDGTVSALTIGSS